MEMRTNLQNGSARVALVTGGAQGIGEAIVKALVADGLAVAIADLRAEQAQETAQAVRDAGGRALGVSLDVTDSASVTAGLELVRTELGEIDVLVNNAGWDDLKLFVNTDEEFWDRVIEVNFKGALRLTHGVLPGMIDRRWGRIVNIGSDAGRVGSSLESVYSGAKGGIIAFTKTIAREVARKGVTANAVCRDRPIRRSCARPSPRPADSDKVIGAMVSGVPMKRLAEPREIAAAVRFFAHDDAGYVTGQTLSVSGGLTMAIKENLDRCWKTAPISTTTRRRPPTVARSTDVHYEIDSGLAWITINRPERFNSFRAHTVDELILCFKHAWASPAVGVVCLTGAGDRAFSTGGDQKQRAETGDYGPPPPAYSRSTHCTARSGRSPSP